MFQIRPWLYTGSYHATQDLPFLKEHGITAMLQLHRPVTQPAIVSLFIHVEDGYPIRAQMLDQSLEFVATQKKLGAHILIACGSGISRSSLFAMAALTMIENISLTSAFWQVREANPRAMPDEIQWNSVCKYLGETVEFWDLWRNAEL